MDCDRAREAISARLDGEEMGIPAKLLEAHMASCARCASFEAEVVAADRAVRNKDAMVVPDLAAPVLSVIGALGEQANRRSEAWWRWALVVTAVAQLALTLPQLLGTDAMGAPYHVAQELGSLDVALGIGYLAAAWRPVLARGLAVVAVVAALGLVVTAGADIANHTTTALHELDHLPAVLGSVMVCLLGDADPRRSKLATPRAQ